MTARYRLVARLAPGLARIERTGNDGRADVTMWDVVTLRKPRTCALSGRALASGDLAYRPLNNSLYRYERIAATEVHGLTTEASTPNKEQR